MRRLMPACLAATLLATWAPTWSAPGAGVYRARGYVARWRSSEIELLTPAGKSLCRWPVGALCAPADPDCPAAPSLLRAQAVPVWREVAGVPELAWSWRFPWPEPLAEQMETYRLLPDRVEVRVSVRWRVVPPRLVRMNYGARLAAGCCDLEGLWRLSHTSPRTPWWEVAPVPGVYTDLGETWYRKRVRLRGPARELALLAAGIDDGDITFWDGREIGRTPTNEREASWTQVRRYPVSAPRAGEVRDHDLVIQVHNAAGNGGIWRGPVVLGPAAALDAAPAHDGWTRATARGVALHHWCPDSTRQPLEGRFTVSLTSQDRTREAVPENVTTGGRFLIPPYVVAIESENGWWGLGTTELPRAEDGLRVEWREGTLSCPFLLATEPNRPAGAWTEGPTLALLTGDSKAEVLATYLRAVPRLPDEPRQDWWSGPCYCTWGDQVHEARLHPGGDVGALNEANLGRWLGALSEKHLPAPLVTLDAGWWQLPRRVIRDLHAQGRHVTLWTQPHWGPDTSQHPERAIRDANDHPLTYDRNNWILDYTSPAVREAMAGAFRSYVAPGEWGADGIKLDFCYTSAPVWSLYSDPSWGAGELYRARVLRFVYETTKAQRPDALVTGGTANPLFGRVEDVCRLNEDWFGDPQIFRRRAATVLALGQWAECDDWSDYEDYLLPQAVERPLWGTFTLMSGRFRQERRTGALVPLSPAWAARLSAIMALAQRIPVRAGERCLYDPDRGLARRETAGGELVAAALPLEGTSLPLQTLVVAQGDRLLVCSVAEGTVRLPTDRPVRAVTAVGHDGTRRAVSLPPKADGQALQVPDSASEVAYVEVELGRR